MTSRRHLDFTQVAPPAARPDTDERTAALVAEHWPAIERLACELLERERLDRDEANILIEIVRGEASEQDLERYRLLKAASMSTTEKEGARR